ncbi:MAG TPA: dTDP-4-dehydrorhamnose 3,5-epimerase [Puia sp.]|nr:dTDP-4-dehydrorhamnose 3,5-epimerase [Puia sp.]
MPFQKTDFPGLMVYEPVAFKDERGFFFESYNEKSFLQEGIDLRFIQDNQSHSKLGVIRGLHYQLNPHAQAKLVRTLAGKILDIAIDLRRGSPKFGKVFAIELSADNKKQLLIPKGFAHGFSVLSETADVLYKCDNFYNRQSEGGIIFNDRQLNIDWQLPAYRVVVSSKDLLLPTFADCKNNFEFEGHAD